MMNDKKNRFYIYILSEIILRCLNVLAATNYILTTLSTINFENTVSQEKNTGKYTFYENFTNDCRQISMNSTKKQILKLVIYLQQI